MAETRVGTPWVDYERSDYIPPSVQGDGYWPRTHMVADLVRGQRLPGEEVCELGCNAGHLLALLGLPCWGYDIADGPLAVGLAAGHDVRKADITKLDNPIALAPIVVLAEVLEHLEDPHAVIAAVARHPVVRMIVASAPYLEDEHDHYEQHLWAWDMLGFAEMFTNAGWTVRIQDTAASHQGIVVIR